MWVSLGLAILHVAEALSPESVKCFIASSQTSEGSFSQVLSIRTVFTVHRRDRIFANPPMSQSTCPAAKETPPLWEMSHIIVC